MPVPLAPPRYSAENPSDNIRRLRRTRHNIKLAGPPKGADVDGASAPRRVLLRGPVCTPQARPEISPVADFKNWVDTVDTPPS